MNIIYFGYWGFFDGLSQSTCIPNIKILSKMDVVRKIYFFTIERNEAIFSQNLKIDKATHIPLKSSNSWKNKTLDFFTISKIISKKILKYKIDKIIYRGAPAGAIGYLVWKQKPIKYVVESFEPHADYMLDSKVWTRWDPRYIFQKYWESKIKTTAEYIITVSNNYKNKLKEEGVKESKIKVVPCCTDLTKFKFDKTTRLIYRKKLNIKENQKVGIYVGKFGGIYYDELAFDTFEITKQLQKDFYLIILSPDNTKLIEHKLLKRSFKKSDFYVAKVNHSEIPKYLSASDFAFSTIKKSPNRKYCSAIKNGEYWANGLPILLPNDIGDDSSILLSENGGVILDIDDIAKSIKKILRTEFNKKKIMEIAYKYRNLNIAINIYEEILKF